MGAEGGRGGVSGGVIPRFPWDFSTAEPVAEPPASARLERRLRLEQVSRAIPGRLDAKLRAGRLDAKVRGEKVPGREGKSN